MALRLNRRETAEYILAEVNSRNFPLALELAAARLSELSPAEVASRLDRRFGVLRDAERIGRHETMYATISWSYDLVDRFERELFDRLSVFHGGFDLEAVEAVAGRRRAAAQRDLRSLVAKSMVVVVPADQDTGGRVAEGDHAVGVLAARAAAAIGGPVGGEGFRRRCLA